MKLTKLQSAASTLYNDIGHDCCWATEEEMADILRDRMAEYLQDNEPELALDWSLQTPSQKIAICLSIL